MQVHRNYFKPKKQKLLLWSHKLSENFPLSIFNIYAFPVIIFHAAVSTHSLVAYRGILPCLQSQKLRLRRSQTIRLTVNIPMWAGSRCWSNVTMRIPISIIKINFWWLSSSQTLKSFFTSPTSATEILSPI